MPEVNSVDISENQLNLIAEAIVHCDSGSVANDILIATIPGLSGHVGRCTHCDNYAMNRNMYSVIIEPIDSDDEDEDEVVLPIEQSVTQQWCLNCAHTSHRWRDGFLHNVRQEVTPIPAYHETKVECDEVVFERADILGIELETFQSNVTKAARKLKRIRNQWKNGVKYERDGSLHYEYGVEIASRPFTLKEIKCKDASPWHEICDWSMKNGGTEEAGDGYGMHISLNGGALNRLHRGRIMRFINSNRILCEKIAGRRQHSMSIYRKSDKLKWECCETDKYQAAANRGQRIEVRIFKSSLNWDVFVRNCEFVDAVRVFTEFSGISDNNLSEKAFKDWLQKSENRKSYPLLSILLFGKKTVNEELVIVKPKRRKVMSVK